MQAAPIPDDEDDRLRALRALLILDTPPEDRFDRIVAFAAQEFDMPMAFVTLVDAERQWFKARVGSDTQETARDVSFCAHAILQDEPLVIDDAQQDARFRDNPLVTGAPHIRFYAGAQLALPSGQSVGTLCIIDRQPRTLDRVELAILKSLRDLAVEELTRQSAEAA